jgi:hypothetical protein
MSEKVVNHVRYPGPPMYIITTQHYQYQAVLNQQQWDSLGESTRQYLMEQGRVSVTNMP